MENPIKSRRKRENLSQTEFANYADVSRDTVTKLEAGIFGPLPPKLYFYCSPHRYEEWVKAQRYENREHPVVKDVVRWLQEAESDPAFIDYVILARPAGVSMYAFCRAFVIPAPSWKRLESGQQESSQFFMDALNDMGYYPDFTYKTS